MKSNGQISQGKDNRRTLTDAYGRIPYNMTNDYMFRAVLQTNNKVLKTLIAALLHLDESDIRSVQITNPIVLGASIELKEIRLDVSVLLNNDMLINLEMQVANKLNWNNRSVLYLCRTFDQLNHGEGYNKAHPAIHIGFLDYTLFDKCPEFYATYKLMNVKKNHIYSDNLTLSVVDLTHIELATEEDKKYHIDSWAKLFKATTWEEIKVLASKDENICEAANTIFQLSADEQMRKWCRDREEYYQDIRNYERVIAEKDADLLKKDAVIIDAIAEKESAVAKANALFAETERLRALLKEHGIIKSYPDKP